MVAVVRIEDFDCSAAEVTLFDGQKEAEAFLENAWQEYYNIEIAESSALDEGECWHENDIAQVKWTDGCTTKWYLTYEVE